jgi:hypothetical protein
MCEPAGFQHAFGAAMARPAAFMGLDRAMARALRIHRNTSAKAAQDAVLDNYPVVRALVGDAAFQACAAAFVEAHPPREPRLCLYGAGLDRFLAGWSPFLGLAPWLADVASLERLVTEALFAADAPALDGAAVAERLGSARGLAVHPAARFAPFQAPAAQIWLAHHEDAPADALEQIQWRAGAALVTRPDGAVRVTPIGAAALAFLQAASAGLPLTEVAQAARAARPAGGPDIAAVFSSLIIAGAFA